MVNVLITGWFILFSLLLVVFSVYLPSTMFYLIATWFSVIFFLLLVAHKNEYNTIVIWGTIPVAFYVFSYRDYFRASVIYQ
jgi:hypothetical protein